MIYVGIDPGARWTGVAILHRREKRVTLHTMVIDGDDDLYLPVGWLASYLKGWSPGRVIAESFRVRPVGHQAFSNVSTARLLGALEWETYRQGWSWSVEPPGDIARDLERLKLAKILASWRSSWPESGDARWGHALSAWRVLGFGIARVEPELLLALSRSRRSENRPAGSGPEGSLRAGGLRVVVRL